MTRNSARNSAQLCAILFCAQFSEAACAFSQVGTLVLIFVVFNVAVWAGKPLENDIGGSTISALARPPRRSGGSASSWTRRRWSRATRCSTYERFDTALNNLTEN